MALHMAPRSQLTAASAADPQVVKRSVFLVLREGGRRERGGGREVWEWWIVVVECDGGVW